MSPDTVDVTLPALAPHLSLEGTSFTLSSAAFDKMGRSPMAPTAALRSFGVLELPQALADFASLEATDRRALRIHVGAYDMAALDRVCGLLETAARARP
jgi:hypothetical protein